MNLRYLLNCTSIIFITNGWAQECITQITEEASMSAVQEQKQTISQTPEELCLHKFRQGDDAIRSKCMAGYNAPAEINVGKDVNFYSDVSYTFWFIHEHGLLIATNAVLDGVKAYLSPSTNQFFLPYKYHSGFKVGVGLVASNEWNIHAEYTWVRATTANSADAPMSPTLTAGTATATSGTSVWSFSDWLVQSTSSGQPLSASSISASWHLSTDILDLTAGRPFYQGQSLTVSPYLGLRGIWIRQMMSIKATEAPGMFVGDPGLPVGSAPAQPITSTSLSNCWGVGPIIGCNIDYLLGYGFRVESDIAGSLPYTRYTTISRKEDRASTSFNPGPYFGGASDLSEVRPMAQAGLGLGWGWYTPQQGFHIDFTASYDFLYFWNQNVFRLIVGNALAGSASISNDMFFHGLTIKSRFDF